MARLVKRGASRQVTCGRASECRMGTSVWLTKACGLWPFRGYQVHVIKAGLKPAGGRVDDFNKMDDLVACSRYHTPLDRKWGEGLVGLTLGPDGLPSLWYPFCPLLLGQLTAYFFCIPPQGPWHILLGTCTWLSIVDETTLLGTVGLSGVCTIWSFLRKMVKYLYCYSVLLPYEHSTTI